MKFRSNIPFKKIMFITLWILLGSGTVTLLVSAYTKNQSKRCLGLSIQINGVNNHFFIDKKDIKDIIYKYSGERIIGKTIHSFDLLKIEKELEKDVWLKKATLYFDNRGMLIADIEEREPVARLFTKDGNTFYIDQDIKIMPLSNRHTVKLPVFTGYDGLVNKPTKADSVLLKSVKEISLSIQKDTFLMAMIDQVDIMNRQQFELIPKMGNMTIIFGDTDQMTAKFEKLKLFYQKVVPEEGWNKYNRIDLTFKNQVVARIRGLADVTADSLRAVQIMKALAEHTSRMSEDTTRKFAADNASNTTDISLILQSLQRDEQSDDNDNTVASAAMAPKSKADAPANKLKNQKNSTKNHP